MWWDKLTMARSDLAYYPNAGKCWLVAKPNKEETDRSIFEEIAIIIVINVTTEGQKHLGATLILNSTLKVKYTNVWGK